MNIYNYGHKSYSQVLSSLNIDSLIITNGTDEYNITIQEFFNIHNHMINHDHTTFKTGPEVVDIAQTEATSIANTASAAAVNGHLTAIDHTAFIDSITATNIANVSSGAAIAQHLIDADHGTSGFTGEIYDMEDNLVTVEDGVVKTVAPSVWHQGIELFNADVNRGEYRGIHHGYYLFNQDEFDNNNNESS